MEKDGENRKVYNFLDKTTKAFEIGISFVLLILIGIKFFDMIFVIASLEKVLIDMDFERILSMMFSLVIGVEFIRMLFKHTPETVIYVLLFAIARQMILYNEGILHMLMGVLSIAGLFAAKKYFIDKH